MVQAQKLHHWNDRPADDQIEMILSIWHGCSGRCVCCSVASIVCISGSCSISRSGVDLAKILVGRKVDREGLVGGEVSVGKGWRILVNSERVFLSVHCPLQKNVEFFAWSGDLVDVKDVLLEVVNTLSELYEVDKHFTALWCKQPGASNFDNGKIWRHNLH